MTHLSFVQMSCCACACVCVLLGWRIQTSVNFHSCVNSCMEIASVQPDVLWRGKPRLFSESSTYQAYISLKIFAIEKDLVYLHLWYLTLLIGHCQTHSCNYHVNRTTGPETISKNKASALFRASWLQSKESSSLSHFFLCIHFHVQNDY